MKKVGGLARVPKGLAWIDSSAQVVAKEPILEPQAEHSVKEPAGYKRATFIVREGHLELLKAIAYWDNATLKDVIDDAINCYLSTKNLEEYKAHLRAK